MLIKQSTTEYYSSKGRRLSSPFDDAKYYSSDSSESSESDSEELEPKCHSSGQNKKLEPGLDKTKSSLHGRILRTPKRPSERLAELKKQPPTLPTSQYMHPRFAPDEPKLRLRSRIIKTPQGPLERAESNKPSLDPSHSRESADPQTPSPAASSMCKITPNRVTPQCKICHVPCTRIVTSPFNKNGNAGRPHFRCTLCDAFHSFEDGRGVLDGNPQCHCKEPSRLQVAGQHARISRGLHYVCAAVKCGFAEQDQIVVDNDLVGRIAKIGLI